MAATAREQQLAAAPLPLLGALSAPAVRVGLPTSHAGAKRRCMPHGVLDRHSDSSNIRRRQSGPVAPCPSTAPTIWPAGSALEPVPAPVPAIAAGCPGRDRRVGPPLPGRSGYPSGWDRGTGAGVGPRRGRRCPGRLRSTPARLPRPAPVRGLVEAAAVTKGRRRPASPASSTARPTPASSTTGGTPHRPPPRSSKWCRPYAPESRWPRAALRKETS
jgi:hypothetical protein